jgi:hypothetical protein
MAQNAVKAVPLTSILSSTLGSSYLPINSTGLPYACFLLRIVNDSTQPVTISYDGINDHEYLLNADFYNINGQTNAQPAGFVSLFAAGTKVYVKGTAGTGSIYLSAYYNLRS